MRLGTIGKTGAVNTPPAFSLDIYGTNDIVGGMEVQPEQLAKVFGENVRRRRGELKLSQQALARRSGVPQPDISEIEQGKRPPNLATIAKIAEGLATPPSHLLSAESLAAI